MRMPHLTTLTLGLCLLPVWAAAQTIQPGLWEISSQNMQMGGQALPGMQAMLEQLKNLPPEQRQMMEQMMAKQGVQLGEQGVQVCMSKAQVEAEDIPLQDPKSGCNQQITERSAQSWKFRFDCPQGKGEGETRFLSDKEFITTVSGTFDSDAGPQDGSMESHARWVAADCAGLQPRQ
ncbi:DUF3617 domain-containing protein [Pseudomonas sp. CrR25]|nr:DUF3617 domain-containing protein [Pseudomonas sp. CrR25]